MRHNETHFEQVPLDVVETALERVGLQSITQETVLASVLTREDEVVAEFTNQRESVPSKSKP
jgi:hypothetical protein